MVEVKNKKQLHKFSYKDSYTNCYAEYSIFRFKSDGADNGNGFKIEYSSRVSSTSAQEN